MKMDGSQFASHFSQEVDLRKEEPLDVNFSDWTSGRELDVPSTNAGSSVLAFQGWRRFKEAFAPEIIERAVRESDVEVANIFDPFGGSGTTALASQFLGAKPLTIEVNPYLADLIEAKIESYDVDALANDLGSVVREVSNIDAGGIDQFYEEAPPTFLEPGVAGRWIFGREVAEQIYRLLKSIEHLQNQKHSRLLRVLLGGIVVEASNVIVSGKGRRYRRGWQNRQVSAEQVLEMFCSSSRQAILDIYKFAKRPCLEYSLLRGDSRELAGRIGNYELSVFSPPYPNSFDYTDVYNVELWALGYLTDRSSNRKLRLDTLSSHVQIKRDFACAPDNSPTLNSVIQDLETKKDKLWNTNIPDMVGGYFADLHQVLAAIWKGLCDGGSVWLVIGDSQYSGVEVPTAQIVSEMVTALGFEPKHVEPFRSMRNSVQQGWNSVLAETLVILQKN